MKRTNRSRRRRTALFVLVPVLALLLYLLWPLTSRDWIVETDDDALDAKADYLAAQPRVRSGPRIVLILADDLGITDISRYAGEANADSTTPGLYVPTPAIDSIGHDGATFTQAGATATICAPSRAALLTGRYQQRYGFELQPHDRYPRNRLEYLAFRYLIDTDPMRPVVPSTVPGPAAVATHGLPASEVTLAELLAARGYETAAFGKWHLGYDERFSPLRRGYDEHYGFYEAFSLYAPTDAPEVVNTRIDDFSDKHMWAKGRTGASAIVHNDLVVEEDEYLTFALAQRAADYIQSNAQEPFFLYLPFSAPHTPLQAPQEYYARFSHMEDPIRRTYAAMIATLDDAVATVLDALETAGIDDETIVVFASDNGGTSYLGVTDNGPLAGGKFTTYQGGIAVPLMIRYPDRVPPGTVYREPVSLLDVFSTIESATRGGLEAPAPDAATAPPPPGELRPDGVDLVPYLTGETDGVPHDTLFWRSVYNKAARRGDWKLVVTTDGSPGVEPGTARHELYNLAIDPAERVDVADEHPEIVVDLVRRLSEWEETLAEPLWPPVMHFRHEIRGRPRWFGI